jgi:glycosyl transferase family 25
MKIYIIHYTKLHLRKEKIIDILKNKNFNYEFIEEYDKEFVVNNTYYSINKNTFEQKIKNLWNINDHKFRILNDAEISCTIKHILAIEKISKQNEDCGLILEDDVLPVDNSFAVDIQNIIKNAPSDWDAIFIGSGCGYEFINEKIKNISLQNKNFAKIKHPATNCAEAYILKKDTAKKIYESIIPFNLVSDWELAYQFYKLNMNVYWFIPALFYQGSKSGQYSSTLR